MKKATVIDGGLFFIGISGALIQAFGTTLYATRSGLSELGIKDSFSKSFFPVFTVSSMIYMNLFCAGAFLYRTIKARHDREDSFFKIPSNLTHVKKSHKITALAIFMFFLINAVVGIPLEAYLDATTLAGLFSITKEWAIYTLNSYAAISNFLLFVCFSLKFCYSNSAKFIADIAQRVSTSPEYVTITEDAEDIQQVTVNKKLVRKNMAITFALSFFGLASLWVFTYFVKMGALNKLPFMGEEDAWYKKFTAGILASLNTIEFFFTRTMSVYELVKKGVVPDVALFSWKDARLLPHRFFGVTYLVTVLFLREISFISLLRSNGLDNIPGALAIGAIPSLSATYMEYAFVVVAYLKIAEGFLRGKPKIQCASCGSSENRRENERWVNRKWPQLSRVNVGLVSDEGVTLITYSNQPSRM